MTLIFWLAQLTAPTKWLPLKNKSAINVIFIYWFTCTWKISFIIHHHISFYKHNNNYISLMNMFGHQTHYYFFFYCLVFSKILQFWLLFKNLFICTWLVLSYFVFNKFILNYLCKACKVHNKREDNTKLLRGRRFFSSFMYLYGTVLIYAKYLRNLNLNLII